MKTSSDIHVIVSFEKPFERAFGNRMTLRSRRSGRVARVFFLLSVILLVSTPAAAGPITCPDCKGTGKSRTHVHDPSPHFGIPPEDRATPCPICGSYAGSHVHKACPRCHGTGEIDEPAPAASSKASHSDSAPQPTKAESSRALVQSGAELITSTIYLGEILRANRLASYPPSSVRGNGGGFFARAFTCDANANRPTLGLGWCNEGDFYGLAQIGGMGLLSVTDGEFFGALQVSALYNNVKQSFHGGVQFALANQVDVDFAGLLQGGVYNVVLGDFRGIGQVGIANTAGTFRGLTQLGMVNTAGLGPILQVGLYSDAGDMKGVQVGGFLCRGSISGLAFSGLINLHEEANGVQVGLINHARTLRGIQLGAVNIAKELHGLQIGLANISEHGGLPFMVLINVGGGR